MGSIQDFFKGVRAEFPTLEEALSDKRIEAEHRLIDLTSADVKYDAAQHSLTYTPDGKTPVTVLVQPEFHRYMDTYADKTQFITRNGTPWLAPSERENDAQKDAYMEALKSGPKEDTALIIWRKTNAATKDTGHATIAVGHLHTGAPSLAVSNVPDQDIEGFSATEFGGYYPSQTVWVDRASRKDHMDRANSNVAAEDPKAHALGLMVRNAAIPTAVAASTAIAGAVAIARGKKKRPLANTLKAAAVIGVSYAAGRLTSIGKSATGTVMLKEDEGFHGTLATLVTPSQKDVMEHIIVGFNKTYSDKYNIMTHNCADFAEETFAHIGLNTHSMVQDAMETEPNLPNFGRKIAKQITLPSSMRPDRHQWAVRKLKSGQQGFVDLEGQKVSVRTLDISDQSSVFIETDDQSFFMDASGKKARSEDVLDKVFGDALRIAQVPGSRGTEFMFNTHAKAASQQGR